MVIRQARSKVRGLTKCICVGRIQSSLRTELAPWLGPPFVRFVMCCLCSALITLLMFAPLCPSVYVTAAPWSQADVRMPCEITSMCESGLNSTHTHTHKHTHWPPGWGVCLCLSLTHLWRTPPCSVPYKTAAVGAARRGLLTSTRGDVTVSLGKTDRTGTITTSVTAGHCKPPRATSKQVWLPLRNPWRWCPSSRGNASVSHVWF